MPGSLDTTNTMLAIIAAVSVLQGLVLIGLGVAGWKIYKLATSTIQEIDERRVKPIAAKVEGLVDRAHQVTDRVHEITDRVHRRAEKVEHAIDDAMGRVNHTASAARSGMTDTVHRVSGAVSGLRAALVNALTTEETPRRYPAPAPRAAAPLRDVRDTRDMGAPGVDRGGNGHAHDSGGHHHQGGF